MKKFNAKPANPKVGDLCVWHNPQVGRVNSFYYPVDSVEQAKTVLNLLADYDLWQYENRVKGDYASAAGLSVFEGVPPEEIEGDYGDGWCDWQNGGGYSIDEIMRDPSLDKEYEEDEGDVVDIGREAARLIIANGKWEQDCQRKEDFDISVIEISSRLYSPDHNQDGRWSCNISILMFLAGRQNDSIPLFRGEVFGATNSEVKFNAENELREQLRRLTKIAVDEFQPEEEASLEALASTRRYHNG